MATDPASPLASVLLLEPTERLGMLADLIENGSLLLDSRRSRVELAMGGSTESIGRICAALKDWAHRDLPAALLAEMARTEIERRNQSGRDGTRGELVWTGPTEGHPTARRTEQVLHEMLAFASREVLIVGYSLFLAGPAAQKLLQRLGELSTQGVDIRFLVDWRYRGYDGHASEGHSVREIQKHWPTGRRRPSVLSWTNDVDASAKLHAKVVAIDSDDVLVTSANLTGAGMDTNLEFGLRARGRIASDCAEHFHRLISSGLVREEPWLAD